MSEESNDQMLLLMKELVSKVKSLEEAVYNKDNLLMKSGYVVVDSQRQQCKQQETYRQAK